MNSHTLTCFQESGGSPSRPETSESEPSRSASVSHTPGESSPRTSGRFWPTPRACDGAHPPMGPRGNGLQQAVNQSSTPTCEPSPAKPIQGLLFSQADFPANPFPSPGSSEARRMTVSSGRRCSELLRMSGPLGCRRECVWNRQDGTRPLPC